MKVTPHIKKRIRYYAEMLQKVDPIATQGVEDTPISGKDLLLANVKVVQGEKVDPNKTYLTGLPVTHFKNHEKALLKAYKTQGKNGVFEYLENYLKSEQEYVNALRHEIFSSGNFEPNSMASKVKRKMCEVKDIIAEARKQKRLLEKEKSEELIDKAIIVIGRMKREYPKHREELDRLIDSAYRVVNL